jgi:hypothetical protein
VSDRRPDDRLPPPTLDEETEGTLAQAALPASRDPAPSQLRRLVKPLLTGLVKFAIWMMIPIVLVVILAFVAQMVISSH